MTAMLNLNYQALKDAGVPIDDQTMVSYYHWDDKGTVVGTGNMAKGMIAAYNYEFNGGWQEGRVPIGATVNPKTGKPATLRGSVTPEVKPDPAPLPDPPPVEVSVAGTLSDLVEAIYWRERGQPEAFQRWLKLMDVQYQHMQPRRLFRGDPSKIDAYPPGKPPKPGDPPKPDKPDKPK